VPSINRLLALGKQGIAFARLVPDNIEGVSRDLSIATSTASWAAAFAQERSFVAEAFNGMAEPRTAKLVIDQAIRENRSWEWLCFLAAGGLVLVGLVAIVRAMFFQQDTVVTVVGGIANLLFYPPLAIGQRIRKENFAVRLLEVPLCKATTEEAAANMLREMFVAIFVDKKG
jgi:hypothetical protein